MRWSQCYSWTQLEFTGGDCPKRNNRVDDKQSVLLFKFKSIQSLNNMSVYPAVQMYIATALLATLLKDDHVSLKTATWDSVSNEDYLTDFFN